MQIEPMFPPGHPAAGGPLLSVEMQILNVLKEIRDLLTPAGANLPRERAVLKEKLAEQSAAKKRGK